MKPYKILIFIVLVISVLAVVCLCFPKDGVKVGGMQLRFPTFEDVLVGQSVPDVQLAEVDSAALQQLNNLKDSLQQYRVALSEGSGRIYLPGNDVSFFDPAFESMENAQQEGRVIRVLHYGDSQIEMDRISGNLRTFFQSTFGGGGPGLVPVVQTNPSFAVSQYASGALTLYSSYGDGERCGGNYGLMAKCYRLSGSAVFGANASRHQETDRRVKMFSRVTLLYNDRDGHFSATLRNRKGSETLTCSNGTPGVQTCRWQLDSALTSLRISMQGNADLYGIMLDGAYGVAVDNIPLRGSSGGQFTMITDTLLRSCYQLSDVGIIIMQFGGNSVPAIHTEKALHNYCVQVEQQIKRIRSCCPSAPILFIGPSDMSTRRGGVFQTYPMLPQTIDSLRAAVLRNHAAYWDLYEVMGGQNAMVAWVQNGLAGTDYIHFTPKGAAKVGKLLASKFALMYDCYRLRQGMDKQQLDTLWNMSAK